jgi:hypothetical protein
MSGFLTEGQRAALKALICRTSPEVTAAMLAAFEAAPVKDGWLDAEAAFTDAFMRLGYSRWKARRLAATACACTDPVPWEGLLN